MYAVSLRTAPLLAVCVVLVAGTGTPALSSQSTLFMGTSL